MASFNFELVSPERILFSGDVTSVIVPATEGEMTVLAGHAPTVGTVRPGVVLVQTSPDVGKEFYVCGGLFEIGPTGMTILAEKARFIEDVSLAVIDAEIVSAETYLTGSHSDAESKRLHDELVQLREFRTIFATRKAA
jgi:F-type H+-transporting ATPase subunit epsilon